MIFYNDFLAFDPAAEIRGTVGGRYPVIIAASAEGIVVDTAYNGEIEIMPASGVPLRFFDAETGGALSNTFTLVQGQVTVWVGATGPVDNGEVIVSTTNNTLPQVSRNKIYFEQIPLWIFYSDYPDYDLATELRGIAGIKYKITIVALSDGSVISTTNDNMVGLRPVQDAPLRFYTSEDATTPDSVFQLVDGQVDVWITSMGRLENGSIEARSLDTLLRTASRSKIYFSQMPLKIFYDDFLAFNPEAELRGYVGMRYPIIIAALIDSVTVSTANNNALDLSSSQSIQFFGSETDTAPATTFSLSEGQVKLWVTATAPIENGLIQVASPDSQLQSDSRNRVYFSAIPLVLLYGDTLSYDPAAEIRGAAGERFPVTIRASIDGTNPILTYASTLNVESPTLKIFASSDLVDETEITEVTLSNGEAVVWVTSFVSIANASISVSPASDLSLSVGSREQIYFTKSVFEINRAVVSADNGYGMLDRIDLYYTTELTASPDSVQISWPAGGIANTKTISGSSIVLDNANAKHVIVSLPEPFPEALTTYTGSNSNLGRAFWSDPALSGSLPDICPFNVTDSIGPLLTSAVLLQRFDPGK